MIICCGFVNSGTRLLHKIVTQDLGLRAVHRSYPHWEKLWTWQEYAERSKTVSFTWIAISRRPDVCIPAAHAAGHPGIRRDMRRDPPASIKEITGWYESWLKMSASMPAFWIRYERLVASPETELRRLATHLGVEPTFPVRQIRDENAKWLEAARS